MYPVLPMSVVTVGLLALGFITSDVPASTRQWSGPRHEETRGHIAEVVRIRAHFDSVLAELPFRDAGILSPRQRQNRAALMWTLRQYRDAGVFPHNYDFPGEAVPYFVDRRTGTVCAVAHLLESTGRRDIVDRVAAEDNNVRVHALAGDTAFTAWLHGHGLTLDEAAWIQVPYMVEDTPMAAVVSRDPMYNMASTVSTVTATTLSLVNVLGNRDGRGSVRGVAGMAAGVISLGIGAAGLVSSNSSPLAISSLVTGGLSAYLSTRGLLRQRSIRASEDAAARGQVARATVSPLVQLEGSGGTGLAVSIRF